MALQIFAFPEPDDLKLVAIDLYFSSQGNVYGPVAQ